MGSIQRLDDNLTMISGRIVLNSQHEGHRGWAEFEVDVEGLSLTEIAERYLIPAYCAALNVVHDINARPAPSGNPEPLATVKAH